MTVCLGLKTAMCHPAVLLDVWLQAKRVHHYMYMDIIMFVPRVLRRPCAANGTFKFKLSAPHAFSRHVSFVCMCRYRMVGQTQVTKVANLLV